MNFRLTPRFYCGYLREKKKFTKIVVSTDNPTYHQEFPLYEYTRMMEFGSSQVRESPDASEEVRIEDETADVEKELEPLGNVERSSSVRASSITRGSVERTNSEDGPDENVELDQDGGIKQQAAAATAEAVAVDSAAATPDGDDNATPHWQKEEKQESSSQGNRRLVG